MAHGVFPYNVPEAGRGRKGVPAHVAAGPATNSCVCWWRDPGEHSSVLQGWREEERVHRLDAQRIVAEASWLGGGGAN